MQSFSDLHKAARAYAEAGIPVFPVEVNGKKPVTPNGFYDATTDIGKIDEWWKEKDYNVALSPGDCGLTVIDFDPGARPIENLPRTYTVRTPRGLHLYFEGVSQSTASKLEAHIDTRSLGGYVLAPPSCVAGNFYTVIDDSDYAPLPSWISEALKKSDIKLEAATEEKDLPGNITRVKDLLNRYVEDGKVAIEGSGGDDLTYRICCEVLDFGLSPETAFDLLDELWNPACIPPWHPGELAAKIQNAAAYQQNEAGSRALEPTQKVFGSIVSKLFPVKRSRFYFKDETEQENDPDPQWIIKDLISERSTVLLYGPTQSYKSFLCMEIALSLCVGCDTFGSKTSGGKVFYSALEGKAHIKKARRAWKIGREVGIPITNFFLGTAPLIGIPGEIEEFCDEIEKRCGEEKPKLIILDTLGKAMSGLNENDALDAGLFIRFCDHLVERFGASVIAIHHTGKDQNRGARGSSAFHAGFDTVIEVAAHRATKAVEVRVKKHKDAEERELPWTFEGRLVGGSLVFFATDSTEHFKLTNEQSELSPRKIGAILQNLKAYGMENAITTNVLAGALSPRQENQSQEHYQIALSRTMRILHKAGKDFLEAYTVKSGKHTLWALPVSG